MQTIKSLWSRTVLVIATVAMAVAFNAAALPVISVVRSGPLGIYKGSCAYSTTTFTITADSAVASAYDIYFYLGGAGNGINPPPSPCYAVRTSDFTASGTGLEYGAFGTVPNLYEISMPAYHTSVTITVTALDNASSCTSAYQDLILNIPSTTNYTENAYTVSGTEYQACARIYPADPGITVGVSVYPGTIYKQSSSPNSLTLEVTASSAFPGQKIVTFLIGGNGTTDNSDPSSCLAYYPTDFTVSGCTKAPFPNGFYVVFNEGETTKTITVTAAGSGCGCDDGFSNPDNNRARAAVMFRLRAKVSLIRHG